MLFRANVGRRLAKDLSETSPHDNATHAIGIRCTKARSFVLDYEIVEAIRVSGSTLRSSIHVTSLRWDHGSLAEAVQWQYRWSQGRAICLYASNVLLTRDLLNKPTVLPTRESNIPTAVPAETVTKIALRLKHQIETVIPCEVEEDNVVKALSPIVTPKVVETAAKAGGEEHRSCVVYGLLVCKKWFKRQALLELWDADLHGVRATACEIVAKRM